jgi:hypothetical protein
MFGCDDVAYGTCFVPILLPQGRGTGQLGAGYLLFPQTNVAEQGPESTDDSAKMAA